MRTPKICSWFYPSITLTGIVYSVLTNSTHYPCLFQTPSCMCWSDLDLWHHGLLFLPMDLRCYSASFVCLPDCEKHTSGKKFLFSIYFKWHEKKNLIKLKKNPTNPILSNNRRVTLTLQINRKIFHLNHCMLKPALLYKRQLINVTLS